MNIIKLALLCVLLTPNLLQAEIYKWEDSNGNIHFSDKAQPGAETVTLPPTQTYSPPKQPEQRSPSTSQLPKIIQQNQPTYTKIMILQPQDQETLRSNQGLLTVITRVEPELGSDDFLQLIYDASPLTPPQKELAFSLTNIIRGSHTLQLNVINKEGAVIGSSAPITFFMHHTRVGGGN